MGDTYTHGHHESVLRSHTWRTVENSARYLLGSLRPGQSLLDVGCGPGTITIDLAARVAPGAVVGIDRDEGVISAAAAAGADNVVFQTGDVHDLGFADASFDVVHAHQVLQHLTDPVAALREMRRVLRPGGTLAVRDSDYAAFAWAPRLPGLDRWIELYHQVAERNGAEPDAGRHLLGWAQAAGLSDIRCSSSTWTYATPELRSWWGGLWADRIRESSMAEQAISYGVSDRDELDEVAQAWLQWADAPDGWFVVLSAEVLATR